MKIIAGLGNPTDRYAGTRHNVGFAVIDELAERLSVRVDTAGFRGLLGSGRIGMEKVFLVKPLTYMNLSGECLRPMLDYYRLTPEDLIVCYDDASLDIGMIRIRARGSAGGHNGMKSIIGLLGTEEIARVRVGIGEKDPEKDLADHVLGRFAAEDLPEVRRSIRDAAEAAEMMIREGISAAMNRYNRTKGREDAGD